MLAGRGVCQCFNVSEAQILGALPECAEAAGGTLAALAQRLKCGTNCGSCLPELRALAARDVTKAGRMVA